MKTIIKFLILVVLSIPMPMTGKVGNQKQNQPIDQINIDDLKSKFLQLCDVAVQRLNLPERKAYHGGENRKVQHYVDSYAVRALAVAYDLTGKEEYLATIKTWADRMITFQEKMIPKGGYYMNYGRAPFQTAGNWYAADCGSIAMGVLATAIRCSYPLEKLHYINSVKSFAKLILDNYIGPNGGITDGIYDKFDGEYYCSTATVGSLLLLLYDETGEECYLDAGLNAVNWLSRQDLYNSTDKFLPTLKKREEGRIMDNATMFYFLEAYSAGLPHITSGKYPILEELAQKQIALLMTWFPENLCGKGESGKVKKYDSTWGVSKFGGLPFHIYAQMKIIDKELVDIADKHLQLVLSELFAREEQLITEPTAFTMMAMAEKISPGAVYRKSKSLYEIAPNR